MLKNESLTSSSIGHPPHSLASPVESLPAGRAPRLSEKERSNKGERGVEICQEDTGLGGKKRGNIIEGAPRTIIML